MNTHHKGSLYIVDDDEAMRDALGYLVQSRGLAHESFENGDAFLNAYDQGLLHFPGVVILDVRMPGISGIQVFEYVRIKGRLPQLPIIFLTGHGDVPMAVDMVKKGALDFFEKPFSDNAVIDRALEGLQLARAACEKAESQDSAQNLLARLSGREKQVLEKILDGKFNKVIADELNISMRTVEVHRAKIFQKMEVRTAVELAQKLKA